MDEGSSNTPDRPRFVFDPNKPSAETKSHLEGFARMHPISPEMITAARFNAEGFVNALSSSRDPENRLSPKQIENVVLAIKHYVGRDREVNPQEKADISPVDRSSDMPIIQQWVGAFGSAVKDQIDQKKTSQ